MDSPVEMTVPEAATFLKVNQETVRRNIRTKRLQAFKRGTQWFISREDIQSFASHYNAKTGRIHDLFQ